MPRLFSPPMPLLAIAFCMGVFHSNPLLAEEEVAAARSEMAYELDPYYSDVSYNIPLTDKPIPTITSRNEAVFYHELVRDSLIPQYMLLEASVYPLPILGTYLKTHQPGFYREANIGQNINVIDSLTAGFQEPWALSVFVGSVAKLKRPEDKGKISNYGYTGYLLSVGAKHIKNNVMVDDDWAELEWKIKGKIERDDEKLSWSFRFGAKLNRNHEVNNVNYIKLYRSNTEFKNFNLTWLENTNLEFSLHFLQHGGKLVRSELIAGKKMPLLTTKLIPTLNFGFIWTSPEEYSGALRDNQANRLTLVVRPSIEF